MAQVLLLAGLGFGDEGKGTCTDWLVREHKSQLVVRYNGGSQAAHNVVDGDKHHTFAQFGSGTLAGAKTYLSRFMLVEPLSLMREASALRDLGMWEPLSMMYVDRKATGSGCVAA